MRYKSIKEIDKYLRQRLICERRYILKGMYDYNYGFKNSGDLFIRLYICDNMLESVHFIDQLLGLNCMSIHLINNNVNDITFKYCDCRNKYIIDDEHPLSNYLYPDKIKKMLKIDNEMANFVCHLFVPPNHTKSAKKIVS